MLLFARQVARVRRAGGATPSNHISTLCSTRTSTPRAHLRHFSSASSSDPDAIIIGAGHNGLVAAAYLAKAGVNVRVLENRHVVGGAAVTEEIIPGFKFSRASYLAGLLRPQIISDLGLAQYGFKYLRRNPSSFTPTRTHATGEGRGEYLMLGSDDKENVAEISKFSKKDAKAFLEYETWLSTLREFVGPIIDGAPPENFEDWREALQLAGVARKRSDHLHSFYELMTAPAATILDRWFESEILKTTLATDAVIGAMLSPTQPGSAYVLFHHVMGESDGQQGVWSYVEGGMGALSKSIADAAQSAGADIRVSTPVNSIIVEDGKTVGVTLRDGSEMRSKMVISNCTPHRTFTELIPKDFPWFSVNAGKQPPGSAKHSEGEAFIEHIRNVDYACGAFKINCALKELPNFTCYPTASDGSPGPQHRGTVHFESKMSEIEDAFRDAIGRRPATRPVIEMTIPSSLDKTISPPGQHVCQLFVQFAPYDIDPKVGSWSDEAFKKSFIDRVFSVVDEFAPNFSKSVIGYDALSPLDLEQTFGLHRGNIFHGALSLNQLAYMRPAPGYSHYRSPIDDLYMCGSGTHPGGGVTGAPGRNCAQTILRSWKTSGKSK